MAERMLRWDEASGELQEVSRRVGEYDTEYLMDDGSWQREVNDGGRANVDTGSLRYYVDDPGADSDGITGSGAVENPAGWQNTLLGNIVSDLRYWTPGTVLSQDEVAGLFTQLANPTFTNDAPKSLQQYLSDPRSVVRVEDGKYVYRPELAQGDYVPTNARRAMGFGGLVGGWLSSPPTQIMSSVFGGGGLSSFANVAGQAASTATDNPVYKQIAGLVNLGNGLYNSFGQGATDVIDGESLGSFLDGPVGADPNAVYDATSGLGSFDPDALGDLNNLGLEDFIDDVNLTDTGAVYTPDGSLLDSAASNGLVDKALKTAGEKVVGEVIKNALSPNGSSSTASSGATTAAAKAPIDLSGISLGVSPGTSKTLQMLSGGNVYDEAGGLRGGLISPYLKRA